MSADAVPEDRMSLHSFRKWMAVLLIIALASRLIGLQAFPEFQDDEGLWTRSAKNFFLFGDWFLDRHTHLFLSPVFHGLSLASFWAFGPSIASARVISGIAGAISILLLGVLVSRSSGRRDLGFATAALFGLSQWAYIVSRQAMIEPLQLMWLLAALLPLTKGTKRGAAWSGLAFALALLTKINSIFFAPVLLLAALLPPAPERGVRMNRAACFRGVLLLFIGFGVAFVAYWLLFRGDPGRFMEAFGREGIGLHLASVPSSTTQVDRFGLDPVHSARTVIALIRESPFLMVLAVLGLAASVPWVAPVTKLFAAWVLIGSSFFILQSYQPIRYFFLTFPAFLFFAARFALSLWGPHPRPAPWYTSLGARVVGTTLAFNLAYAAMNTVANPETRIQAVRQWVTANVPVEDRLLTSVLFATDLPNRAYAHDRLIQNSASLLPSIRELGIRYVLLDNTWPASYRGAIESRFQLVQSWPFAQVYLVAADSGR